MEPDAQKPVLTQAEVSPSGCLQTWRAMGDPDSPAGHDNAEVLRAGLTHSPSGTGAWALAQIL